MAERLPYTVENVRPRRTLNLYGRVLASQSSGGRTEMDLSEEQILGDFVLKLIKVGRLQVVRMPEKLPASLWRVLNPSAPVLEATVPVEEPPAPEPTSGEEVPPTKPEPPSEEGEVQGSESEEGSEPTETHERTYTREQIEAVDSYRELQKIAKSLNLPASGTEEALRERILASQGVE